MRRGTFFEVKLSQLSYNIEQLKKMSKADIVFMVKSDGYGHGIAEVVRHSNLENNVTNFGVATVDEAIYLRNELPLLKNDIYVFSELNLEDPNCREYYTDYRLLPVISSIESLKYFLMDNEYSRVPVVIKINTGMNRLGIRDENLQEAIELLKRNRKSVYHLMGHLSNASNCIEEDESTKLQQQKFLQIKKMFTDCGLSVERTSLANSGAIEQGVGLDETHIRPGLMLYGPSALARKTRLKKGLWQGRLISRLHIKRLSSYKIKKGEGVGYGLKPAPDDGFLHLMGIGYGDGLPHSLSQIKISIGGKVHQILGKVNMDIFQLFCTDNSKMVDVHGLDLWDDNESLYSICEQAKVSPYELLCQITSRVPKIYTK